MADEKTTKQELYEAMNQFPAWTGQDGLFGFLGDDHFGAEVFTDYLHTVKTAHGGELNLSDEVVNPEGFLKFVKYNSVNDETKYGKINSQVTEMISNGEMTKENFIKFSRIFNDLGIVENRTQLTSRYETAVQSIYTENPELLKPNSEERFPTLKIPNEGAEKTLENPLEQRPEVRGVGAASLQAPTQVSPRINYYNQEQTQNEEQTQFRNPTGGFMPENIKISEQEERIISTTQSIGNVGTLRKRSLRKGKKINRVSEKQLAQRREQQQLDQQNFQARQQQIALAEQAEQQRRRKKRNGTKIGRITALAAGGGAGLLSLISGQAVSTANASDFGFNLIHSIIKIIS